MSDGTTIEWAAVPGYKPATLNPAPGCRRMSPGCEHCYAETMARRHILMSRAQGRMSPYKGTIRECPGCGINAGLCRECGGTGIGRGWSGRVNVDTSALMDALRWHKPRAIFLESMGDLFHSAVPDAFLANVFDVLHRNEEREWPHLFLLLTKRPARMAALASEMRSDAHGRVGRDVDGPLVAPMLRHVWWGTSVEDQTRADERVPHLLRLPKHGESVRFVSYEPALGPADLRPYLPHHFNREPHCPWCEECIPVTPGALTWRETREDNHGPFLDWVIVGGESGPRARPCDAGWIRDIVRQCADAGVPAFVKQLGARPYDLSGDSLTADGSPPVGAYLDLSDRKGAAPSEWPEDVRVRRWPRTPEVPR